MIRRSLLALSLAPTLLFVSPASAQPSGSPADVAAIQALGQSWQTAWNARDAAQLGAIMASDSVFVSVLGPDTPGFGRGGRGPFQAAHAGLLKSPMFADSVWTTRQVDVVKFLTPDVAVAQVVWETTGDKVRHVKHGAPRRGIFLWVVQKTDGRWLVVASQNTEAVPPLPGQ